MTIPTIHDEAQVQARGAALTLYFDLHNEFTGPVLVQLIEQNAFPHLDVFVESLGFAVYNRAESVITVTGHFDVLSLLIVHLEGNPVYDEDQTVLERTMKLIFEQLGYGESDVNYAFLEFCLTAPPDVSDDVARELWDFFDDLSFATDGHGHGARIRELLRDPHRTGNLIDIARESLDIEVGQLVGAGPGRMLDESELDEGYRRD